MSEAPIDLELMELAGTPEAMGRAFGEQCRAQTRELFELRLQGAIDFAFEQGRTVSRQQVIDTARRCLDVTERYDPVTWRELEGIARGSNLLSEELYVANGLTDLRDVVGFGDVPDADGCSCFIVAGDRAAAGRMLVGQNWDLATSNMPYVRLVHRRPSEGPATCCVTLTGCLSLIGMNSEGIAVGNTNLRTRDARIGVHYLSVIHRALRSRTVNEAMNAIRDAPRAGGHYYYIAAPGSSPGCAAPGSAGSGSGDTGSGAGGAGMAFGLECTAAQCETRRVAAGTCVHCNHVLCERFGEIEVPHPTDSTRDRQHRLERLLDAHTGPVGIDDLKRMLSDHEGDGRAICRHHVGNGVSTNASVIMCPAERTIHACRAQPHVGTWVTREV